MSTPDHCIYPLYNPPSRVINGLIWWEELGPRIRWSSNQHERYSMVSCSSNWVTYCADGWVGASWFVSVASVGSPLSPLCDEASCLPNASRIWELDRKAIESGNCTDEEGELSQRLWCWYFSPFTNSCLISIWSFCWLCRMLIYWCISLIRRLGSCIQHHDFASCAWSAGRSWGEGLLGCQGVGLRFGQSAPSAFRLASSMIRPHWLIVVSSPSSSATVATPRLIILVHIDS